MITLRPYQAKAVSDVMTAWGETPAVMLRMPTGAGKTKTACDLIRRAVDEWGKSVAVLVHTRELRRQWIDDLSEVGIAAGAIAAGVAPDPYARCQVVQVQSLAARLEGRFWVHACDLMVIDEAHHAATRTYVRIIDALAPKAMLGLSATPARLDGKGLRPPFGTIVHGPEADELIKVGALNEYRITVADRTDLAGIRKQGGDYARGQVEARVKNKAAEAVNAWRHEAGTHQTIAFCVTRNHGRDLHARFNAAGIRAGYADGSMHHRERDREINHFRERRTQVLVSVDLLGEGIDIPGASCALICRPTASITRHLQGIGRVIRPHDHPSGLSVIVDTVGNCERLGGPRTPYEWTLDGVQKKSRKPAKPAEEGTGAKRQLPQEQEARMIVIDDREIRVRHNGAGWLARDVATAKRECETLGDFKRLGAQLGYKRGWAFVQYRLKTGGVG